MNYYIKPTSDIFMKYLFGSEENSDLLLSFINAVLDDSGFTRIVEVAVKNPFNIKSFIGDKESILDVKAKDENGRWYDIEVQSSGDNYFIHRTLYYWSKLYSDQLGEGREYARLKPAVCINILDFMLFKDNNHIHNCYLLRGLKSPEEILTDHITLHYIELPKMTSGELKDKLSHWITFLRSEGKEEDSMQTLLNEDMDIKRAHQIYNDFTANSEMRELYEAREKWRKDNASRLYSAKEEGIKEGLEQGLEQGELLEKQNILIKLLSKKFGITEEETLFIGSIKDPERLQMAIEELIFAESKDRVWNCLK